MKKNTVAKNSFRSIKRSYPRFLSLIIMSLLGVFVFTGLQATSPDMIATLDSFLDERKVYDIRIVSTLGLTDDDITFLEKVDGIDKVEASHSADVLIHNDEKDMVLQVLSIPSQLNLIELIEGKLPETINEIVVEKNMILNTDYKIGDEIMVPTESFSNSGFTIVGIIDSPLFYNNGGFEGSRGSTSVGSGSIDYYSYVLKDSFTEQYYTSIYLTVKKALEYKTSSFEYLEVIQSALDKLEAQKEERETARFHQIYNDAKSEIDKNKEKIDRELNDAHAKLVTASTELSSAKKKLDLAKGQLDSDKSKLNQVNELIKTNKKQLQDALNNYGLLESDLASSIVSIEKNITLLNKVISSLDSKSDEYAIYQKQLQDLQNNLKNLQSIQSAITTLNQSETEYQKNLNAYQSAYKTYQSNYKMYEDNYKKYQTSLKEYNKNKEKAYQELDDAYKKLETIEKPKWFLYDRTDYATYAEYIDDTNSIYNLSKIFPIVFFAVSILVSLISMNRMVEDDRGEIGTLKSLGFHNHQIMSKYLLFSFLAVLIGGVIGCVLGNIIIPTIIFGIYKILFAVPNFQIEWNVGIALTGLFLSFVSICGTTFMTALKVLKEKPSDLMRPKAPKSGKRVFLEHIPLLWERLKFSNKVTIRNLFRYKKRILVTIGGIAGCTALILCGFGIKDGIVDLTDMQYGKTFSFDALSYVNDMNEEEIQNYFQKDKVTSITPVQSINASYDKTDINIMIFSDQDALKEIVSLKNKNDEAVFLADGAILITDKFADIKKLKVGDTLSLVDVDKKEYSFKIGGIVKNYVGHIAYVSKDTFLSMNDTFQPNVVYLKFNSLLESEEEQVISNFLENDKVINVSFIESLKRRVSDMLKSLDQVVLILIVLASLLAFVVLYNLSNININERKREIATLKVLGFYHHEVDSYITKENIILTILGISLGLVLGYFLTNIVITTVEIEKARFIHQISLESYLYAVCISCLFTIIVNFITHFSLKKIDMIESLKSVE